MKIKALVEKADEEVEIEVELPFYHKEVGPDYNTGGRFSVHTKIDVDQIITISYRKEYNQTDLYDVKIEKSPANWMDSSDTYYFAGKKENSLSAIGFKKAQQKALNWMKEQQNLLNSINI